MNAQLSLPSINPNINLTLAIIAAVFFGAIGFIVGRGKGYRDAIPELQHALDRAARDIRIFAAKGRQGVAFGPSHQACLQEAEQIVRWRSQGFQYLTKPTGESRMRPPDEPRSVTMRRAREAARLRNEKASFWGGRANLDDTYVSARNAIQRRYE